MWPDTLLPHDIRLHCLYSVHTPISIASTTHDYTVALSSYTKRVGERLFPQELFYITSMLFFVFFFLVFGCCPHISAGATLARFSELLDVDREARLRCVAAPQAPPQLCFAWKYARAYPKFSFGRQSSLEFSRLSPTPFWGLYPSETPPKSPIGIVTHTTPRQLHLPKHRQIYDQQVYGLTNRHYYLLRHRVASSING